MPQGTFKSDITKWVAKAKGNVRAVAKKIVFDLGTTIITRTPVDTGRLVGNWQYAEDHIPGGTFDVAGSREQAEAQFAAALASFEVGHRSYFINNLPYGPVVEYGLYPNPPKIGSKKRGESTPTIHVINGYSTQAPAGMVRITVVEFQQFVAQAVNDVDQLRRAS